MGQILQNARNVVKRNRAQCKMDAAKQRHMDPHQQERALRLKEARENAGFSTARSACERFGWKESTYGTHESGHRGFIRHASKYAVAYKVNVEWLLTGRCQKNTTVQGLKSLPTPNPKLHIDSQRVPLLLWGMINSAKSVQEALREPASYVNISTNKTFGPNAFEMIVADESMCDPKFPLAGFSPGQELIFDPDVAINPGDYVLAQVDSEPHELFRSYKYAGRTQDGKKRIALTAINGEAYGDIEFIDGVNGKIIAKLVFRGQSF